MTQLICDTILIIKLIVLDNLYYKILNYLEILFNSKQHNLYKMITFQQKSKTHLKKKLFIFMIMSICVNRLIKNYR